MCEECGCGHAHKKIDDHDKGNDNNPNQNIEINKSVTEANDAIAHQIWHFLKDKNILCINLMGAPGSGKTTFIEGLVGFAKETGGFIDPKEIAVIQGDLESDIDKKRLEEKNIQCHQINTHSGCHLNAAMINKVLLNMDEKFNLNNKKFLIIENVGNLVCPAGVKIGQHMNIVISSTTEGSDKPKKYPIIFYDAGLVVISKYDLKEAVEFDEESYIKDIKNINSKASIAKVSSKKPETFSEVAGFIKHEREHLVGKEQNHSMKDNI